MTKNDITTILYSIEGKELDKVNLTPKIFGAKVNQELMAQAVRVYLANQRIGTADTKTRGEVRGGGRKPWKQKGTGRARQGSIRSPLWVKGGIAHGPHPKDWSLKLSKKMKRAALFSALTEKYNSGNLRLVEKLNFEKPTTRKAKEVFTTLGLDRSVLVVWGEDNKIGYLSFRNLEKVESLTANQLNTYDILNHKYLVLFPETLTSLEKTFLDKENKQDQLLEVEK